MLMSALVLLAVMLDRLALSLRTLSIAALVLLLLYPESVISIGFQLSFLAVFALVAIYERTRDKWPLLADKLPGLLRRPILFFGGAVLTGLIATLATAPLILFHFQQMALYGVIANVAATPLLTFITMPLALLSLASFPFGLEAWPLKLMGQSVQAMNDLALHFADKDHAVWLSPIMPAASAVLLVFTIIFACLARGSVGRMAALACLIAALAIWPFAQKPILYVYPPGKAGLIQGADGRWLQLGRNAFLTEQWARQANIDPSEIVKLQDDAICDKAACRLTAANGVNVSIVTQAYVAAEECGWADIIISDDRLGTPCTERQLDRYRLMRDGPAEVSMGKDGPIITTLRIYEGTARPWRRYGVGED
jgi:competence protein ComEC